jgi:glycosyltransferase involved in cell wall biosynthesis
VSLTVLSVAFWLSVVSPESVGGAEQILLQVDEGLVRRGHNSLVIARPESKIAGRLIPTLAVEERVSDEAWRRAHDSIRRAIGDALRRYPVDIVHLHGIDFADYLPEIDVPVLVTLHLPMRWYKQSALKVSRANTFFHCVSRSQRKDFPNNLKMLPEIENGVSADLLRDRAMRTGDIAVALGRICPEKGFHLALRACRKSQTRMLLAGKVFPFREHQAYFAEEIMPELDRERRYVGPVGMRGKCRLLSSANCVIVPSLAPETSSLVAREALACGTPVVAFATGALPEVVQDGETGFLVERPDELSDAIQACRHLDREKCRRVAKQRFSPERMLENYVATYRGILEGACRVSQAV